MLDTRFVTCPACDGLGEIPYGLWVHEPGCGYGHMSDEARRCDCCDGTGKSEQQVEPITLSDLTFMEPVDA